MDTSGPAFPFHVDFPKDEGRGTIYHEGMTLRDYFAAKAMSSAVCLELSLKNQWENERRSEWAYIQADAMLKAREQ